MPMKRRCRFAFTLIAAVSSIACAGPQVRTQYDPTARLSELRTFDWLPRPEDSNPAADVVPGFRERLRATLEASLQQRGVRRIAAGGKADFFVVVYTHTKTETHQWVSSSGYPYGPWGAGSWGGGPWGYAAGPRYAGGYAGAGSPMNVEQWRVSTLVIDFVDGKRRQLVWRGWSQASSDAEAPEKKLLEAARAIVERFPPQRR